MRARWYVWLAALAPLLLAGIGCSRPNRGIAGAFPTGSLASPWVLDGQVWSGTFAEAMTALGPDADAWAKVSPQHVWLAVYRHETNSDRKLTVRAFSFDSRDAAKAAYQGFAPADATEFRCGDAGCWTEIGVLFVWGRVVFDVFGPRASLPNELDAARLAAFIQKRMPPGTPDAPQ